MRGVINALQIFRNMYEMIPSQTIEIFLRIAEQECTRAELADAVGLDISSVLRSLDILGGGEYRLHGKTRQGLRLITKWADPDEPRRFVYGLTPRGKVVKEQVMQAVYPRDVAS